MKRDEMIGSVIADDGSHIVVLAGVDGSIVLRISGTPYKLKRPRSRELGQILQAAARHEGHQGVMGGHR